MTSHPIRERPPGDETRGYIVDDRGQRLLNATVILWLVNPALKSVVHSLLVPFNLTGGDLTMVLAGLLTFLPLLLFVAAYPRILGRHFYWIYLVIAAYFAVTLAVHPEYGSWYGREFFGVSYTIFRPDSGALWAVLMVELSRSPRRLWGNLKIAAVIMMFYNVYLAFGAWQRGYWTFVNSSGQIAERSYDLDFGYSMMFVALVFIAWAVFERRWVAYAPAILSLLLVLWQGSRGALLCLLAFVVLATMISQGSRLVVFLRLIAVVGIGVWLASSWEQLAVSLAGFIQNGLGIQSRTLTSILMNQSTDDTGRSGIYVIADQAIRESVWGYGAFGDRPIVGPAYFWGYSHNLFYELALNVGAVLAALLLISLVIWILVRLLRTRDLYMQLLLVVLTSMCMRLVVSDTFWGNGFFWMLVGVLISMRPEASNPPQVGGADVGKRGPLSLRGNS